MTTIAHIDPDEFLVDTFRLGKKVYLSGFRPRHAISIWRGGTPVGLGVGAFFRSRGVNINHTTIATGSYTGIGEQGEVTVKNLEHLVAVVCPEDGLLIIDDVYESGNTIRKVVELLRAKARANAPRDIRVAAVHEKPSKRTYDELPVIALRTVDDNVWIDYPHELADLVSADDPDDTLIREKDEQIWHILRGGPTEPTELEVAPGMVHYPRSSDFLRDCVRLGVNMWHDSSWRPDFLIALWPGGVVAGLPVHETFKYFMNKTGEQWPLDHISLNTSPTRSTTRNQIIGLNYLEDHIDAGSNVLIIDSTFGAGRLVNDVVIRLKEVLRRNLNHKRVRVASLYYNPDDQSTWTVRPDIKRPHYYLRRVLAPVVFPASVQYLPNPQRDLLEHNPELWDVLYGEECPQR